MQNRHVPAFALFGALMVAALPVAASGVYSYEGSD